MAYDLGCRSREGLCGYLPYFDRVVRDKPMTALDKFNCGFALSDAGITEDEYSLAVDLDKHAVPRYHGSKLEIQERDHRRHKITCRLRRAEKRDFEVSCEFKLDLARSVAVRIDQAYGRAAQKIRKRFSAFLFGERTQVVKLRTSDSLHALRFKVIEKSRKLKSRTCNVRSCYVYFGRR